jgi:hypothetical protein
MPLFERTYRVVDVPIYREKTLTPYARFGDWFVGAILALLFIVLVVDILPKKKRLPLGACRTESLAQQELQHQKVPNPARAQGNCPQGAQGRRLRSLRGSTLA